MRRRFVPVLVLLLACLLAMTNAMAESEEARLTGFVSAMMAGDENDALYAQFDANMRAALPQTSFNLIWTQLEDQFGPFEAFYGETEVSERDGYTVLSQAIDMSFQDLLCTMSLNEDGTIAGLYFAAHDLPAATAAPDLKVLEEKVSIGERPWRLPGTLLIPDNDDRVPAVILVQGSGATNRDEAIYAVRPFRDIAQALSAQGIAVLRYDKRTYVYGTKITSATNYRNFTVEEEIIQDAIAAARLLAADERIDDQQIFLLGHSLGAMLAPRIVSESGGLFSGMILASGTNRSFLDVLLRQAKDADYITEKQRVKLLEDGEAIYAMTAEEALKEKFNGIYDYYYWEMLQYPTAAEYLTQLALPTLIINGSRDIQVNAEEGRATWEQTLDMDAPWLSCYWTDVNHMLMRPEVSESVWGTVNEYKVQCTVAEDVTDMMASFILSNLQ